MLASPSVTVVLASASNSDVQDSDGIVLASTSVVLASAGVECAVLSLAICCCNCQPHMIAE